MAAANPARARFGAWLAAARLNAGYLTQQAWADALNGLAGAATLTRAEVGRWERGVRVPDAWLGLIAESLNVPLADLAAAAARVRRARPRPSASVGGPPWRGIASAESTTAAWSADAIGILGPIQDGASPGRSSGLSGAPLEDLLVYLDEQWHALVKADNLLGPRHALIGVSSHLAILQELAAEISETKRPAVIGLAARYAESAAWLYEDSDDPSAAARWTTQAMEWAYQAHDDVMLAWTLFRRSQQAAASGHHAEALGLAQAARRDDEELPGPMRAAVLVHEATVRAARGGSAESLCLLDGAHALASTDVAGDARYGHGSYCTPAYIELQRGRCYLASGRAHAAIDQYERALPALPPVYRRDRAAGQVSLAVAYARAGHPDQAAAAALEALPIAQATGSGRIHAGITRLADTLRPQASVSEVRALLDTLDAGAA
ncbi:hypothetical protein [Cryptosporangium minutisporangium]|uniref:HTH cro/C1-type domain-containing protein n=1 Tax=Cryptosporangium minutisporangium TaxID=113569 RepID=A0ABP6T1Y2_9ACTN